MYRTDLILKSFILLARQKTTPQNQQTVCILVNNAITKPTLFELQH
jgi:hypothetical protein